MLRNTRLRSIVIFLSVCLLTAAQAQGRSAPSNRGQTSSDEQQIRDLISQYFESFAKKDLDGLAKRWSASARELTPRKDEWQKEFVANNQIEVRQFEIATLTVDGDRANARIRVEIIALDAKTNSASTAFGKMNRSFQFVKETGIWKISHEASAEEELAISLVAATTVEDRNSILLQNHELIDRALIRALVLQGNRLKSQSKFTEATAIFKLAQAEAERIGDQSGLALALRGSGSTRRSQGDYSAALDDSRRSLAIEQATNNEPGIAASLNAIAAIEYILGEYESALEAFEKSLTISEKLNNTDGAANVLNNMGLVYYDQGHYLKSLSSYEKSLALTAPTDKFGITSTFLNIGILYIELGNYPLAQDYLEKALAQAEELGAKTTMWKALHSMGTLQRNEGNYQAAQQYLQRAVAIATALDSKDRLNGTFSEIGAIYYLQGDFPHALESFQKSLDLADAIGIKSAPNLNSIALTYNSLNDRTRAIAFAERATNAARERDQSDALWQTLTTEGQIYAEIGETGKASAKFEEAIKIVESLRNEIPGGESEREEFFENKLGPYTAMVELLIGQNKTGDALAYAERAKGRVLLEVLRGGRTGITKAMTTAEQKREQDLSASLVALNTQLGREKARDTPDPGKIKDLEAQLAKARLDREDFQNSLYAAHTDLKAQRGDVQPLRVEQTRDLLVDDKSALLEYVVSDNHVYLFVLTRMKGKDSVNERVFTLPVKRSEIDERVEQFRQRLANHDLDISEQAAELYKLLVKPAGELLHDKTSLLIVPDGALWDLSFQALQPSPGHFLIEDSAISYAPSLSVLREMTSGKHNPAAIGQLKLLAIGNPELGELTMQRAHTVLRSEQLGPLPEAERQAKALGKMYGPGQSKVYLGSEAREDRIKSEAGNFRILQFATHGVLNNANPMYSHVVLSQSLGDRKEDGLLEAWEIMNLDLNADMVVLSACDTARGRIGAGEGVIGLSWAFFVAGSPTTVVTQWSVESASTTELMLSFHRNLQGSGKPGFRAPTKAEALRQAQLSILRTARYKHPFYWAGFVLVGDGS